MEPSESILQKQRRIKVGKKSILKGVDAMGKLFKCKEWMEIVFINKVSSTSVFAHFPNYTDLLIEFSQGVMGSQGAQKHDALQKIS